MVRMCGIPGGRRNVAQCAGACTEAFKLPRHDRTVSTRVHPSVDPRKPSDKEQTIHSGEEHMQ